MVMAHKLHNKRINKMIEKLVGRIVRIMYGKDKEFYTCFSGNKIEIIIKSGE